MKRYLVPLLLALSAPVIAAEATFILPLTGKVTLPDPVPGPAGPPGPAGAAGSTVTPPPGTSDLSGVNTRLDTLERQMAIVGTGAKLPIPIPPSAWELADHLPTVAGATVQVPAGSEYKVFDTAIPATISCAGMRLSLFNALGGIGGGHRLAWGKGFMHMDAGPYTIQDCGFVDPSRDRKGASDGESSAYAEFWPTLATVTYLRDAFDGQEDGIFSPPWRNKDGTPGPGANVDVVVDSSVFGRVMGNGNNDGLSHDLYLNGHSVVVRNSIFTGTSLGNTIKFRSPDVTLTGNYVAACKGRVVDAPAASVIKSSGNIYVSLHNNACNVQNFIGLYDEADAMNDALVPNGGSFTSDNDTFYFQRFAEVIWINKAGLAVSFTNPHVFWIGAAGSKPPVVTIQGPGVITGVNPFLPAAFTEANRVDAAPPPPADPTRP